MCQKSKLSNHCLFHFAALAIWAFTFSFSVPIWSGLTDQGLPRFPTVIFREIVSQKKLFYSQSTYNSFQDRWLYSNPLKLENLRWFLEISCQWHKTYILSLAHLSKCTSAPSHLHSILSCLHSELPSKLGEFSQIFVLTAAVFQKIDQWHLSLPRCLEKFLIDDHCTILWWLVSSSLSQIVQW